MTVTAIQAPGETKIDDELAKKGFGMESLENLKEAVAGALGKRFRGPVAPQAEDASCSTPSTASMLSTCPRCLVHQEFDADVGPGRSRT